MSRSSRKTWSQESVTFRAQIAGSKDSSFFNFEKRSMLLLALKTAMAAGLCYWLAALAGLQDGYWGSISAIIVLQSNVGSTVSASRDRLIGTLIGASFGAVFSLLGIGIWSYLLAVVTAMVTCSLLGLKNSSRLAGVTVTILMLVHRTGSNWTLPLHRVLEVLLGIVVALAISTLVFPNRALGRLREGLAQEFLMLGALFENLLRGIHGATSEELPRLWTGTITLVESNGLLRESARNEPTSGRASLEALSMLDQFGKELRDILHALELAVRGSHAGGYTARLEPELGKLIADIHRGFDFIAECIHLWKFDAGPEKFSLEDDIHDLENKLAALRPTVFDFPQEEILRAYAIQLHLKQLARLIHSVRIECSQVVEGTT